MTIRTSFRPRAVASLLALVFGTVLATAQGQGPFEETSSSIIVGPSRGAGPSRLLDGSTLSDRGVGFPFGAGFASGVSVALGDFTNDGVDDVVAAMGPGGGLVKLVDGVSGSELGSGLPFGSGFAGGVNVAVDDFDGDGHPDVVTAQASGGSVVAVFSGVTYLPLFAVRPFGPDYRGGVTIATGDVTGDGVPDIVVGQVEGGVVSLIDGATRSVILSGVPFGGTGVFVAAGDVTGDGRAEVIAAPATGAGPVLVYDVRAMAPVAIFMPYNAADGYTGGVRVAASDLDGDDRAEIVTVPGPGGEPLLKVFDGATLENTSSTLVYSRTFRGGVVVAAAPSSNIKFQSPSSTTFTVGTAGSFTVRAKGPGSATISMTGTLPSGVTFTSSGNDTATLAGTPAAGTTGVYPLTFLASNGTGSPATQSFTLTVNQAPAITSAASATFGLGVASSFSITTTGSPQPTVSLTGTLPSGITFTATAGGGTIAGTAAAGSAGTYPLTITASNGVNPAATQSFVLSITSAPAFTSAASATFVVGTPASFSVTTSALPVVNSITRTGTLPGGIGFIDNGNGTATLSGTPAAGSAGSYPLTFTASNGSASTQQNFTLTVNQAPAITSSNATSFALGANGTFTITATGTPTPTLSRTGTLPTGVTFTNNGNGTATLAGTPAAGTAGSYPLTITASNGVGSNAVQSFTLTVTAAPAITSAASATFVAGAPGSFTVTATGGPTPTLSRTGVLPTGVNFSDNGNGTATIAGTPAAGSGGAYPITITATNSGGNAQQSFTLTVNQAPAITSSNATSFALGANGTFSVTTTGFPTATVSRTGTLPSGVSFTDNGNGTATLAGTPAAGTAGSYTQTLTASNGVGTNAVQTFTLTVTAAPAITSANAATFVAGTPGTFTVTATGGPTPTLSRTGNLPTGVNFTDNGNGTATIAGTPAAGSGGSYPITITATNTGGNAQQSFTLTVNQAPAITSSNATSFALGSNGTFSITTTGFPTASVSRTGTLPSGVTFTDNGNGTATLAGTPAAGTAGSYPQTLTAANGVGTNAVQTFTLTVTGAAVITSANAATFVAGTPGTFTVTTTGAPTPTLSRTGTLPTGVNFTDNGNGTATIAGTPAAGSGGTYPITITATNTGGSTQQSFTLTVNQAPAITSSNATSFAVGSNGTFSVTTTGFPTASVSRTGTLPTGVTFTDNGNGTATLTGTPAAGTAGSYPLTVTAANGVGTNAVQTFTLTVTAAPTITSAASATFVAGTAGTFTVTTTGVPTPTVSRTGNLPTGVTFTNNGNGTATIAGTPAAGSGGTYPIVLTATNTGGNAQQNFTLTVNQAPAITSANSVTFTRNVASSFTITTTGFPAPTVSVTGSLPTGVAFTPTAGGGTLSGTPTAAPAPYVVTIGASNGVGSAASQSFTLTISAGSGGPTATNDTFSNGVGNTQYSVGAGTPATPAVVVSGSVLTNDSGTAPLSAGPASIASTNGGQVTMSSNGSFLYTPAAGFAGPSDTFTYTLTDGNAGTSTAVVTINLTGVVWYVNASAAAGGTGRSNSPFNTMTAAASAAQANQIIYVHAGSPAGATALKQSQTLWGAGAAFTLNGLTIPAATTPVLQSTITLANGVLVNSLTVNGNGAAAIAASGLTGTESLNGVSITGGTTGLQLTNVGGTVTVSGGSISGVTTGAEVLIAGGTGGVTIGSSITNIGARSIDIQNRTAGTVSFTGAINDTGTGILLNANTGSTIAFSGGLALATGDVDAFTATGGGTITATQNNTSIVNTIGTNAGTALNVRNTDIGSAGLTFRSISAGGGGFTPGVGIVLDHTGVAAGNGGLTVTGTGTAATGGRIWRKSGPDGSLTSGIGIYLNTTKSPAFNWMDFYQFDNSAIVGREVYGFLLSDTSIDGGVGTTAGANEGPVQFGLPGVSGVNGLIGSGTLRNVTIGSGIEHNIAFYNLSGSMSLSLVNTTGVPNGCMVSSNSSVTGLAGLSVMLQGTAVGSVTVDQCFLRGNRTAAVQASAINSSSLDLVVSNANLANNNSLGNDGVALTNADDASLSATITGTYFYNFPGNGVRLGQIAGSGSASSLLSATITGNTFEGAASAGPGVIASLSGAVGVAAPARLHIGTNTFKQYTLQPGIVINTPTAGTSPRVDVTIENNHVDMSEVPGMPAGTRGNTGIRVTSSQPTANVCANILNNSSHMYPVGSGTAGGILAEQLSGATFRLERGTQALGTPANTVLTANNTNGAFGPSTTNVTGTLTVVENGSCQVPSAFSSLGVSQ